MTPESSAVTAVIALVLAAQDALGAAGDDQDNAQEFGALCRLTKLIQKGFSETTSSKVDSNGELEKTADKLLTLAGSNITEIQKSIKEKLYGLQDSDNPLPNTLEGRQAARQVNSTAKSIKDIKAAANAAAEAVTAAAEAANKKLQKALYGTGSLGSGFLKGNKIFTAATKANIFGADPTHDKNCGGGNIGTDTTAKNAGTTIANDLVCLCIHGQNPAKKICINEATTIDKSTDLAATRPEDIATQWDKLMKHCPDPALHPTASDITTAVQAVLGLLGGNALNPTSGSEAAKHFVLGHFLVGSTGCTGAASQACVSYHAHLKADPPKPIPWVREILEAVQEMTKATPPPPTELTLTHLKALNESAWVKYAAGFEIFQQNSEKSGKSTEDKEKECNTKGKDKQEECDKLKDKGCVFNKDGNDGEKCTLKKEVETELEKATTSEEGKDGKTNTNTTGSNSFVINKTSVLLSFLILA